MKYKLFKKKSSLKIHLGWFKHGLKKESNSIFLLEGSDDYDSIDYIESKSKRSSSVHIYIIIF